MEKHHKAGIANTDENKPEHPYGYIQSHSCRQVLIPPWPSGSFIAFDPWSPLAQLSITNDIPKCEVYPAICTRQNTWQLKVRDPKGKESAYPILSILTLNRLNHWILRSRKGSHCLSPREFSGEYWAAVEQLHSCFVCRPTNISIHIPKKPLALPWRWLESSQDIQVRYWPFSPYLIPCKQVTISSGNIFNELVKGKNYRKPYI
jgi:hypothetical protein